MNYTTLIEQIKEYVNRSDHLFIKQIPNFIGQGLDRIYSEAKNINFEKLNTLPLAINTFNLNKPADWKKTLSLEVTNTPIAGNEAITKFLLLRSYEFCKTYSPNGTITGEPVFYSNTPTGFFIVPTANERYTVTIRYISKPRLNQTYTTNIITNEYPRLLLYACLMEAIPFIRDDERAATIEQFYKSALDNINQDTDERYTDGISKRDKA